MVAARVVDMEANKRKFDEEELEDIPSVRHGWSRRVSARTWKTNVSCQMGFSEFFTDGFVFLDMQSMGMPSSSTST